MNNDGDRTPIEVPSPNGLGDSTPTDTGVRLAGGLVPSFILSVFTCQKNVQPVGFSQF